MSNERIFSRHWVLGVVYIGRLESGAGMPSSTLDFGRRAAKGFPSPRFPDGGVPPLSTMPRAPEHGPPMLGLSPGAEAEAGAVHSPAPARLKRTEENPDGRE